jgi:hypothetical protein
MSDDPDKLVRKPAFAQMPAVSGRLEMTEERTDTIDPSQTSIAEMGERWTKLPMLSTLDDIWWVWSKRASSTSVVASLHRLAVVAFHLVQQLDRNVA